MAVKPQPNKWIKVKKTGVVTPVSEEYFEEYEKDGWFIEVAAPKAPTKKTTTKE